MKIPKIDKQGFIYWLYSYKFIVSGSTVESYYYHNPMKSYSFLENKIIGVNSTKIVKPLIIPFQASLFSSFVAPLKAPRRTSSFLRTRSRMRRLLCCNSDLKILITLTFAENVQDIKFANYEYKKFRQKLSRHFPTLRLLGIIEIQKRGAIHYHILLNCYVDKFLLSKLWIWGFTKIEYVRSSNAMTSYMSKYMSKISKNAFFYGKKLFFYSLNLLRPVISYSIFDEFKNNVVLFSVSWYNKFRGFTDYQIMKL